MVNKDTMKCIIGIDEVGRGPIAGPVAVCAFKLPVTNYQLLIEKWKDELGLPLRDSKKLSKKQREAWFEYLKVAKAEGFCDYVVSFVSNENIDKFGIAKCIQKALDESLSKLVVSSNLSPKTCNLFLDGGLHAPEEYVNQETIIKGDELYPVISLASIVAKVTRDKVMKDYEKEYPGYGFDRNSGYGTKAHYEAIESQGQTPIHRKSFIH